MDSMRRVWYALWFTTGFVVVLNIALHYLLGWVETDLSRGFAVICFTLAAFGFQDIVIARITGGDGIFAKPFFQFCLRKARLDRIWRRE